MSKPTPKQNFQYTFYWDDQSKEFNDTISTYNEMILIVRNLFKQKFYEEISTKIFYMDVDEDSFEIHSQNEFQQVLNYHTNMPEINKDKFKIRLKIIEKKLDISSLLDSSKINLVESNTILYDNKFESYVPKNKKALMDKDNLTYTISQELKSIKDLMVINNQDMKNYFNQIFENKISNYENKIELLAKEIKEIKEIKQIEIYDEKIFNQYKISKEIDQEFFKINIPNPCDINPDNKSVNIQNSNKKNKKKITKKENKKQIHSKEENEDEERFLKYLENPKDIFICTICFINNAKFSCVICENLFLCNRCEYSDSHSYHPRISLSLNPHFNLENISKTMYSKSNFNTNEMQDKTNTNNCFNDIGKKLFYFDLNRDFFCKKLSAIKAEITINSIDGVIEKANSNLLILSMKTEENLQIPIKIKNLSNFSIKPYELLVTSKDSHPLKIANYLIRTKIHKNIMIDLFLEIKADNKPGDYKFEIDLFHLSRKVEFNPIIVLVNVSEGIKFSKCPIKVKSESNEIIFK